MERNIGDIDTCTCWYSVDCIYPLYTIPFFEQLPLPNVPKLFQGKVKEVLKPAKNIWGCRVKYSVKKGESSGKVIGIARFAITTLVKASQLDAFCP